MTTTVSHDLSDDLSCDQSHGLVEEVEVLTLFIATLLGIYSDKFAKKERKKYSRSFHFKI